MSVPKPEQQTLYALAQGGYIAFLRDASGKIIRAECYNCDGHLPPDCTPAVFSRPKNKGLVYSRQDRPYRISMAGLKAVRPQADSR